jgi:hypothetical protein
MNNNKIIKYYCIPVRLKLNDESDDLIDFKKALANALTQRGEIHKLNATPKFDGELLRIIKRIQLQAKLPLTGRIDKKTANAIANQYGIGVKLYDPILIKSLVGVAGLSIALMAYYFYAGEKR